MIFNILDISLLIKLGCKICTSFCLDISSSSFPITFFFTSTWIVDTVILKWCDALGDRAQQLGLPESGIALAHKKEEIILCHRYSQAPCKRFTKLWKIQDIYAVYGWRHSCHVQTLICKPFLGISFRLLIAGGTLTVTCKSTPTLHDLTIDFCYTKSPVFYGLFDFLKV